MKNFKLIYDFINTEAKEYQNIINMLSSNLNSIGNYLLTANLLPNALIDKELSLSLLLTNDIEIAKINQQWQNINKTTNVLSMALFDFSSQQDWQIFSEVTLGDIVISVDTAAREAEAEQIQLDQHILRLFIHGILHIVGLDHQTEIEAVNMYKLEETILTNLLVDIKGLTGNYWDNGYE
ncbi:rRNA maturation RNase YbeY [Rickettsiales bacterium LUAb2]